MKDQSRNNRGSKANSKGRFQKEDSRHGARPHKSSQKGYDKPRKDKFEGQKRKPSFNSDEGFSPLKKYSKSTSRINQEENKAYDGEQKRVYKGRGRDQKPVFANASPEDARRSHARKPSKFVKNTFHPKEEKPKYDLKKVSSQASKDTEIRLNKYIANSGICSRRDADLLIEKGEIKVNGEVVTELGHRVMITDKVVYKGKLINPEKPVYVLLNKPKDFITTTDDPMNRKTVMHLVAAACEERIFPVGRLDRNTTGLLLFTNDGDLASKLSHPSEKIKKIYQVTLDKPLNKKDQEAIMEGLTLEDGEVIVDDLQVLSKDRTIMGMEIHVGKNRIVRRIFAHLGYEVVALDRVTYAGLTKKDLTRGTWRYLTEKEVINLKYLK